jgi:hypothetical protein
LGNKSSVEAPFKLTSSMTLVENIHDIFFKNFLTRLEESHREKPSWPRALSPFKAFTISKTPLSSKALSIHIASSASIELK